MKKRLLSLLLIVMLVVGMVPAAGISAHAATEALNWSTMGYRKYTDGLTQYCRMYSTEGSWAVYKFVYRNMKSPYTSFSVQPYFLSGSDKPLGMGLDNAVFHYVLNLKKADGSTACKSDFPGTTGSTVSFYADACDYVTDATKPVFEMTLLSVSDPTWTWNSASSATVRFALENDYCATWDAKVTQSVAPAADCLHRAVITSTATAVGSGVTYTNTKTFDGDYGPHSYTYSASGNVITETCSNGCGHSETATLKLDASASLVYTGSEIRPLTVEYSSGWQGGNLTVSYGDNTNAGMATGTITKNGATATQTFEIAKGTINYTAEDCSVAYDGNPHGITVNVTAPEGATVTYRAEDSDESTTASPTWTAVGTYGVYFTIEKENYNTITDDYATVTISQAENTWKTEPAIADWTYGEPAGTPTADATFGEVTVEYKSADANDTAYTTDAPTQAGEYRARFHVDGNTNYTSLEKVLSFEVKPVKLTITADDKSKTYGEPDPTLTWQITNGSLIGGDTLTGISIDRAPGEDAGPHAITVSQTDGANPNYDITFVPDSLEISPKTVGIHWGNTTFTYDGENKLPTATPTGTAGEDEIAFTVTGARKDAGSGTATVTGITGDKADNYQLPENVTTGFIVQKADQTAPHDLTGTPEDVDGRENGTITGLTADMEYRMDGEGTYTAITGAELTGLADGTYHIRYSADENHNASPDTTVVLSNDTKLTVTLPETQTGYTLTASETSLRWNESTTLTFSLADGYSKVDDTFAVKVNGEAKTLDSNDQHTISNVQENLTVTVDGVADITAPTAQITLGENSWNHFWNGITFGLFFRQTQSVTITADDKGSGPDAIWYCLATEEVPEAELLSLSWTEYTGSFNIDPEAEYIVYARATDKAGNTVYVNSNGIVLDSIAPVITGIADGETHYGNTTFTVSDAHTDVVTVDGTPVTLTGGSFTIEADGGEHTVAATDKSGNSTATIRVTVLTIASIGNGIGGITTDNVTSDDKQDIQNALDLVNRLLDSGKDFTDEEDEQLAGIKENAEKLIEKVDATAQDIRDITDTANGYGAESVKSDDRQDLQELIDRIDSLTQTGNLTDAEKSALEDVRNNATDLVSKIDETADGVNDLTDRTNGFDKQTVTSDDRQELTDLSDEIDDLLSGDNLNDSEKDALGKVKDTVNALLNRIEKATSSSTTENTDKVEDVTPDNVTTGDKSDLENARDDLEKALEDHGDNLTDDEKQNIRSEIDRIENALEVIERTETVEELINRLPDKITKADADAIKEANNAYNALSKHEQSILDADTKAKLDNANAALEKLNRTESPAKAPATGDNTPVWLWLSLLFVCAGALLCTTGKKKYSAK